MLELKKRITKAYDKSRLYNKLYDDKPWYRNPQTLYLSFIIGLTFPIMLFGLDYFPIYMSIWVILCFTIYFTVVNPLSKNQALIKFKISPNKRFWDLSTNTEFKEKQLEIFHQNLLNENILGIKNHTTLLEEYSAFFESQSKTHTFHNKLIYGGKVFILFLLSVWGALTVKLLEDTTDLNQAIKWIGLFYLLICSLVCLLNICKYGIVDILNNSSRKYLRISKELTLIKLNLELKQDL